MTATTGNLFTRDDTMFGICEALGEDLGFNPNLLRITLAVLLLWNPVVVLASYFGAGVFVPISRLAWPNRRKAPTEAPAAEPMKLAA